MCSGIGEHALGLENMLGTGSLLLTQDPKLKSCSGREQYVLFMTQCLKNLSCVRCMGRGTGPGGPDSALLLLLGKAPRIHDKVFHWLSRLKY